MTVSCGEDKPVYTFELTLSPTEKGREGGVLWLFITVEKLVLLAGN